VTHAGSFLSFTVSLTNLVDLDLHGNDKLDFGALPQWLNQSSVIFLDLSWIPQWRDDPNKVVLVMKSSKKLRHLRFPLILAVSFHLEFVSNCSYGSLVGCSKAEEDQSRHSDETKARNATNRHMNSKFALAVIQTLRDISGKNFQFVSYVTTPLFAPPFPVVFTIFP